MAAQAGTVRAHEMGQPNLLRRNGFMALSRCPTGVALGQRDGASTWRNEANLTKQTQSCPARGQGLRAPPSDTRASPLRDQLRKPLAQRGDAGVVGDELPVAAVDVVGGQWLQA